MRVGSGEFTYEWIEDFAQIPEPEAAVRGWSHHDIATTPRGTLVTSHPSLPYLVELNFDGALLGNRPLDVAEAHGIAVDPGAPDEYVWISDIGAKTDPDRNYEYAYSAKGPHNAKATPDGDVVMELFTPDTPVYAEGGYSPTGAAIFHEAIGGNGDVWVTDGYGKWHVHRYDKEGNHLGSIDGTEGETGAFDEPHAVWIDTRKPDPELYVSDRTNRRIQVYDLEGSWKRSFRHEAMVLPGAFAALGDHLVVADLDGRLDILDIDDELVISLGDNSGVMERPGWPNDLDSNGASIRTAALQEGLFNSPHGVTTDDDGNIYVAEWLIGGRHIKLARV